MVQKVPTEIDWDKWYDFLGEVGMPTLHVGGVTATKRLLQMCDIREGSRTLVVGCGTGYTACEIAEVYSSSVYGIDISKKMIAKARERARKKKLNIEFWVADVFHLPFDDNTFDTVIMESVLNLLPHGKRNALCEIVRVMKPGGRIGVNEDFALPETPPELLTRVTALTPVPALPTPQDLRQLFEEAGLHVIQMVETSTKGAITLMELANTVRVTGLFNFLFFSWRMITDSNLRRIGRAYREGSTIMVRDRDTRDFFGYALIVGQKPE